MSTVVSSDLSAKRLTFFEAIFGDLEGYVCVAALQRAQGGKNVMHEEFLKWPEQKSLVADFVQRFVMSRDVYYCPTLFTTTKRAKEHVAESMVAWADLDACNPDWVEEQPTLVTETSPNRFQALWKFDSPVTGFDAEDISRRLAYKYADKGADRSGWDLTQLLRVPFTYNHKYTGGTTSGPLVKVVAVNPVQYVFVELLNQLPQAEGYEATGIPFPTPDDLPEESGEDLLQKYRTRLQPLAFHLFSTQPEHKSWSEALWQLELFALEAGMSVHEVFVVARDSACNKYARDGVSEHQLWREVCRAKQRHDSHLLVMTPKSMEPLLSDKDKKAIESESTLVDEYIDWAKRIGDAAPQYHQAGAFILLSSLLAGPIRLPTSFGTVMPNLWFMILADTTLTRKSTAMDLAVDMLTEIDADAVLATDGSIEGLMSALSFRPGRPSLFLRDEFSGLLEMMTKKDYYAGMAETLTKLYDGKFQKRILRRDTIEIRDPVLILFAGGIRERILQLLSYEHVASGFVPRFVFITAVSDVDRLRPLGPPTDNTLAGRDSLISEFTALHSHYTAQQVIQAGGKTLTQAARWEASLTPGAWDLYNHFENKMMQAALASLQPDLMTPMFDRLSKSGLKAAVLLAALRMDDRLEVNEGDLLRAFNYVEYWRSCSLEVVENIGRTTSERHIQVVLGCIKKNDGITRSEVMQRYHMTARDAEHVMMTLEQRGLINRVKSGRTERLFATPIPGG